MQKSSLKSLVLVLAISITGFGATNSIAKTIRVESTQSVSQVVSNLTGAIKKAGAKVFMITDYVRGVASVGQTIRPTTLVIFGNPKIGAGAFQVGQTIGLYLPLRVLAYEDAAGKVWMIYHDPADAAKEHGIPTDHPAIKAMQGALAKLTRIAAGN